MLGYAILPDSLGSTNRRAYVTEEVCVAHGFTLTVSASHLAAAGVSPASGPIDLPELVNFFFPGHGLFPYMDVLGNLRWIIEPGISRIRSPAQAVIGHTGRPDSQTIGEGG